MKFLYFIILAATVIFDVSAYPSISLFRKLPHLSADGPSLMEYYRKAVINKYLNIFPNSTSTHKRNVNIAPLKPELRDQVYYAKLRVGNQNFNILIDTGSSNLWIPNKNCTSTVGFCS